MKKAALLIILLSCITVGYSQVNLQWHFNNSGATNGSIYQMLDYDNGDVLVHGYNNGGDIDPGPAVVTVGITNFFARYTPSGNLVFGRPLSYNGISANSSLWMENDNDGNFYFSFRGSGTFDLDPAPGVGELILFTGDMAFVKFDAMGNYLWGNVYTTEMSINWMKTLSDNSLIIAGTYDYGTHDLDPGSGTYTVSTTAWYDGFLAKFDSSGNFLTAKQFQTNGGGSSDFFYLIRLAVDAGDNVYVGGLFEGTFDMDPGPGTYYLTGSIMLPDPNEWFLIKLDSNLDFVYAHEFPGSIDFNIITDNSNALYLSGTYDNDTDVDPSANVAMIYTPTNFGSYYLSKYTPSGDHLWVKTLTATSSMSGALSTNPYFDKQNKLNFDMYLPASIAGNSLGLPQLPANGFATTGQYMVQLDTSGTCVFVFRFPESNTYPKTLVTDSTHFYFASRLWAPGDIQIGPGITIVAPAGSGNEFCLSYYSMDPGLNRITGNAFLDLNNNSVWDPAENGMQNVITEIAPGNYFLSTDNLGNFGAYVPSGNYDISIPSPPSFLNAPIPLMHSANFSGANQVDTLNTFALAIDTSARDMAVYLTPNGPARPGMNFSYNITYTNNGYAPQSGLIQVVLDTSATFISASVAPSLVNGQIIQWQYNSLNPFQSVNINLVVLVATSVQINDTLLSTASITPLTGDDFPANNFDTARVLATGSYDPNSKEVHPAGAITDEQTTAGIDLTYTLNFQNTGNDTAFNIIILDTLSGLLDVGSLRLIASSHPYHFTLYPGNLMEFRFTNILLPDSNVNELLSHGFVKYKIKPKTTLVPGVIIENTAYNYFDFNLPIATNTMQTPIVDFLGVSENENSFQAAVFPNPFSESLYVKFQNPAAKRVVVSLRDVSGRVLATAETTNSHLKLNNIKVENGIYLLEIKHSTQINCVKVISLK